ncbi:DUF2911 domain-containing protein [Hanstruepera ponticola]|uniref:DUF2911 domain-containing protein n=1 Tax=Hanstruepera ponticola TaxID=2042995 RepID=UPI000CF1B3C6|nr:DUF2911 domain-containing protein [Hanstruepera ponticola]
MKKVSIISTITVAFVMLLAVNVSAQDFEGLNKSPMDAASFPTSYKESNKLVKVIYSRPQLKGRDLNSLAPNGKVWRTGANEAAQITFYTNMKMGEQTINAGTYSLFTIPGEEMWTIIINKDINVWGAYSYKESNDVARIDIPKTSGEFLEAFSITFEESDNGALMHMGWGKTRVAIPFTK